MVRYRICPACEQKNDESALLCTRCISPITEGKIVDDCEEQPVSGFRICPACNEKNSESALICTRCFIPLKGECGEKKLDDSGREPLRSITLIPTSSLITNEIHLQGGDCIGRECIGARELRSCLKVSRTHVKVDNSDGIWKVMDLKSSNGTYINGKKIEPEQWREVHNGDELSLSPQCVFLVKIC